MSAHSFTLGSVGRTKVGIYFSLSFAEAQIEQLKEKLAQRDAKIAELEAKIDAVRKALESEGSSNTDPIVM